MSPEQCRGEPLTPASDFYSLGVVLYQAVVGQVPFDDPNPVQVLMLHNTAPMPPLPAEIAMAPLGRAIARALEKDPRARFRTAGEFMAASQPRGMPSAMPLGAPPPAHSAAAMAGMGAFSTPANQNGTPAGPLAGQAATSGSKRRPTSRSFLSRLGPYAIAIVILLLLVLLVLSHYLG